MTENLRYLARQFEGSGHRDIATSLGLLAEVTKSRGLERFPATPEFPEGAISFPDLTIGGKTARELEGKLDSDGFKISNLARSMLRSKVFSTLPTEQTLSLIRIRVADLLPGYPTTTQIYAKAYSLGLDLCPAEVGPQLRLVYTKQPIVEALYIGMIQIIDSFGNPYVFRLVRDTDGSWLCSSWANPGNLWDPESGFVFSLRK